MFKTTLATSSTTLFVGVLFFASHYYAPSQEKKKDDKVDPKIFAEHGENFTQLYGAKGCMDGCHDRSLQDPDKFYQTVRGVEGTVWSTHDRHKDAFLALGGERGKRMEKILKGSGVGWESGVTSDLRCVSCHGVVVDKNVILNPDMVALKKDKTVDLTKEGVTCMACHGMDSRWFDPHQSKPNRRKWRAMTGQEKQHQFGLNDLWDPVQRAKLCSNCHVGNGKDKMVTHEMYAAGHPPLPGFEVSSFSDAMPRHWETLQEKVDRIKKQKLEPEVRDDLLEILKTKYRNIDKQLDQTEMVVTGGVVALRQSFLMVAEQAKQEKTWPELAVFDCFACHHELKSESWRQERGYTGKPGRPNIRPWPTSLAQLAIFHLSESEGEKQAALTKGLADQIKQASKAFDDKPFGRPDHVVKAAGDVVSWLDQNLIERLDPKTNKVFDKKAAHALLDHLVTFPMEKGKYPLDFDSARQVGWAFKLIHQEAYPDDSKKVAGSLARLDRALVLDLPKGKPAEQKEYKENAFLWRALDQLNNYSPAEFRTDLNALRLQWQGKPASKGGP